MLHAMSRFATWRLVWPCCPRCLHGPTINLLYGTTKRAFLIATNSNYICKDSSTIAIKAKALASAADDQGNSLLRAFVKKAQWQRALNLIHHMQRDQTTPDTWLTLLGIAF